MSPPNHTPPPPPPGSDMPAPHPDQPPQPSQSNCGCLFAAIVATALAVLLFIALVSQDRIMEKMKKDQARTLAMSLVNSCKAYYAEYGKYPLPPGGTASGVITLRTDEILTGILLGTNVETNPKKIMFLPELKQVGRGGGFGLLIEEGASTVVDPWGQEYYVLMDADYSGSLKNPNAASTTTTLYQGVIVFSAGPDKDPSTWGDNVTSWDSGKER